MNKASNKQALSLLIRDVDAPPFLPAHLCEVPATAMPHMWAPSSQNHGDNTDSIYQCPDTESLNCVLLSFVGKISQGDFCKSPR